VSEATEAIRVLLVDDQDLFREGVRVIIDAQEGLEVVGAAGDGVAAVRLVDDLAPDVVLMDVRMPEMDGVEATRQIFLPERAGRREHPVRVIVLTTFNLDDRAATAIRYGASGFLLKGTTPVMLRDAIRTVYAGNAVLAPQDLATLLDGQVNAADVEGPLHGVTYAPWAKDQDPIESKSSGVFSFLRTAISDAPPEPVL